MVVYVPEFMNGHAAPIWSMSLPHRVLGPSTSILHTLSKPFLFIEMLYAMIPTMIHVAYPKTFPGISKFVSQLRKDTIAQGTLIGVAGFCWGGKHGILLSQGHKTTVGGETDSEEYYLTDFVFTGHPSSLEIPADITKLTSPVSVALGTADFSLKGPDAEKLKVELEKLTGRAEGSHLTWYEAASHGFAIRANLFDEKQKETADGAEDQAVKFFVDMTEKLKGRAGK